MARAVGWFWKGLIVLGCLGCQVLAHIVLSENQAGPLRFVLMSLPLLALGYWVATRSGSKSLWLLVLLLAGAATYMLENLDSLGLAAAYGVPHAAAYLFLLWLFGHTLLHGKEPLVTRLARRVHGTLPPPMVVYTRRVTLAWCIFFGAQVTASALLFELSSIETWSLFINLLNFPLVALMFAGEYLYRVTHHRDYPQASIAMTIRAFAGDSSVSSGADVR
ncbi:MAG: hypothetical protein WA373_00540 [Burkholderiales bacterium]